MSLSATFHLSLAFRRNCKKFAKTKLVALVNLFTAEAEVVRKLSRLRGHHKTEYFSRLQSHFFSFFLSVFTILPLSIYFFLSSGSLKRLYLSLPLSLSFSISLSISLCISFFLYLPLSLSFFHLTFPLSLFRLEVSTVGPTSTSKRKSLKLAALWLVRLPQYTWSQVQIRILFRSKEMT